MMEILNGASTVFGSAAARAAGAERFKGKRGRAERGPGKCFGKIPSIHGCPPGLLWSLIIPYSARARGEEVPDTQSAAAGSASLRNCCSPYNWILALSPLQFGLTTRLGAGGPADGPSKGNKSISRAWDQRTMVFNPCGSVVLENDGTIQKSALGGANLLRRLTLTPADLKVGATLAPWNR